MANRRAKDGNTRIQNIWANNMAQILWDRQMTQKEMAKLLDIHPVRLNDYLVGKVSVSLYQVERFAKILKVRPESLFISRPQAHKYEPSLRIEARDPEIEFFGD